MRQKKYLQNILQATKKSEILQADFPLSQRAWGNEIKQCLQEQERLEKPNLKPYKQCLSKALQGDFLPQNIAQDSIPIAENSIPCLQKHLRKQQYMPLSHYTLMTLEQNRGTCSTIDRTEVKSILLQMMCHCNKQCLRFVWKKNDFADMILLFLISVLGVRFFYHHLCAIFYKMALQGFMMRDDKVSAKMKESIDRAYCYHTQDFWLLQKGGLLKTLQVPITLR